MPSPLLSQIALHLSPNQKKHSDEAPGRHAAANHVLANSVREVLLNPFGIVSIGVRRDGWQGLSSGGPALGPKLTPNPKGSPGHRKPALEAGGAIDHGPPQSIRELALDSLGRTLEWLRRPLTGLATRLFELKVLKVVALEFLLHLVKLGEKQLILFFELFLIGRRR